MEKSLASGFIPDEQRCLSERSEFSVARNETCERGKDFSLTAVSFGTFLVRTRKVREKRYNSQFMIVL
jgi:hypothetical protein